jgi:hypothetical protein
VATPNPVVVPPGQGATVIQWNLGANVTQFGISGLDATEFTPAASQGQGRTFSTTDANNNAQSYNYTITATHTLGHVASHDPKIENGS